MALPKEDGIASPKSVATRCPPERLRADREMAALVSVLASRAAGGNGTVSTCVEKTIIGAPSEVGAVRRLAGL